MASSAATNKWWLRQRIWEHHIRVQGHFTQSNGLAYYVPSLFRQKSERTPSTQPNKILILWMGIAAKDDFQGNFLIIRIRNQSSSPGSPQNTVVPRLTRIIRSSKITAERNRRQVKVKNPLKSIENWFNAFQWAKYLSVQRRSFIGQPFSGACIARNLS